MSHARLLTVAAVALALGGGAPAHACADNANCGPAASPIRTLYDACSALPILNPGNDTRVNFWLLADDAQPFAIDALRGRLGYPPYDLWPVPFSYTVLRTAALPRAEPNAALTPFALGEGTRCVSEARGRADFAAAVQAAALPPEEKTALENVCCDAYRAMGCRDYARMDVRLRDGVFYILDINPNPDISAETSMACAAGAEGLSYGGMLSRIVNLAARRHPVFGRS